MRRVLNWILRKPHDSRQPVIDALDRRLSDLEGRVHRLERKAEVYRAR